ncbi:unnamed protein product, partial [Prorocentrum cordatum]
MRRGGEASDIFLPAERPHPWLHERLRRVRAVDGGALAIERLVGSVLSNRHSDPSGGHADRFAPLPRTGLTLNHDWLHMTPGAVGCALSHRAVWERLAAPCEGAEPLSWALVLEDDLLWVAPDARRRLAEAVGLLPPGWHVCYAGWHGQGILRLALGACAEGPCPAVEAPGGPSGADGHVRLPGQQVGRSACCRTGRSSPWTSSSTPSSTTCTRLAAFART